MGQYNSTYDFEIEESSNKKMINIILMVILLQFL